MTDRTALTPEDVYAAVRPEFRDEGPGDPTRGAVDLMARDAANRVYERLAAAHPPATVPEPADDGIDPEGDFDGLYTPPITVPDEGPGDIDAETLADAMRSCDGVAWPKGWRDAEYNFDWVARQVAAAYRRALSATKAQEP